MWEALLLSCFRNGSIFHTLQWLENSAPRWTLTQTIQGGGGGVVYIVPGAFFVPAFFRVGAFTNILTVTEVACFVHFGGIQR